MTSDTPADAIADAIRDHDWLRVDHLLRQLLVTDPALARQVYDTIQLGLKMGRTRRPA